MKSFTQFTEKSLISLVKYAFFLALLFIYPSCNNNSKKEVVATDNMEDYYEFQGFDLTPYDLNASIMLPDETANIGASTQPEVDHIESDFYWVINIGQNFHLYIEDYGDNSNLVKTQKQKLSNTQFYDVEYIVDEENLIIYKVKLKVRGNQKASAKVGVNHESFHVYAEQVVNGIHYELRSSDEGADEPIIKLMAKSIKSFKGKKDK
ncbi:MAG: hypothetical protein M9916_08020 [Crocinitomicaceae bacterium]|nr:hypothetical protein [Crocinitomicaceae bacterium]